MEIPSPDSISRVLCLKVKFFSITTGIDVLIIDNICNFHQILLNLPEQTSQGKNKNSLS